MSTHWSPQGTVLLFQLFDFSEKFSSFCRVKKGKSTLSEKWTKQHKRAVRRVKFSLDGTGLFSITKNRALCLWDVETGWERFYQFTTLLDRLYRRFIYGAAVGMNGKKN